MAGACWAAELHGLGKSMPLRVTTKPHVANAAEPLSYLACSQISDVIRNSDAVLGGCELKLAHTAQYAATPAMR